MVRGIRILTVDELEYGRQICNLKMSSVNSFWNCTSGEHTFYHMLCENLAA